MALLVVGSIAFDQIKTPREELKDVLGGSAVHCALAASHIAPVQLVGVVGKDFPHEHLRMLANRGVDTAGVDVAEGKTFRWAGEYFGTMNRRETLWVELNVLENFQPKIPPSFRESQFVFLANGAPLTQLSVLDQVKKPRFVMADTMDLWIRTAHQDVLRLLKRIDGLILNDEEAILLTDEPTILGAGEAILRMGPQRVVIKKGEHGAILFTPGSVVPLPAFPVRELRDPTGAGDSFAGGLMGYLAKAGNTEPPTFKAALAYATVVASFCVEDFGTNRLQKAARGEIDERFQRYCSLLRVD